MTHRQNTNRRDSRRFRENDNKIIGGHHGKSPLFVPDFGGAKPKAQLKLVASEIHELETEEPELPLLEKKHSLELPFTADFATITKRGEIVIGRSRSIRMRL